jgi:acyl dehydratase
MVQNWKQVGPNRYRETFGRYFEDFNAGDIYEHRPGKTVTEYDNHLFTLLTLNTHPMHFDAEFAKASEFKRNLVVSPYTLALLIGMSVTDTSQKAIANLGMDEVKFTAPVFAGDTIYAWSEVLAKAELSETCGALRLRLVAVKDADPGAFIHKDEAGKHDPRVLLDFDYWAAIPRAR